MKTFIIGKKPCGCTIAAMVIDSKTELNEITQFCNEMIRSGRIYSIVQADEVTVDECKCKSLDLIDRRCAVTPGML